MSKLAILCVDDQPEVLSALSKDLAPLASSCEIIEADGAEAAIGVIDELEDAGIPLALVISDHVMPGISGVEFLTKLETSGRHPHLRKILLTGQATHTDTILAINEAHVDSYIAKPWDLDSLLETVQRQLTAYVLDLGLNQDDFRAILVPELIFEHQRRFGRDA